MRVSSNIAKALMPKTASLEQAGGLHRMVLRGHSGPIQKVLLTPGGTDVVTGTLLYLSPLPLQAVTTLVSVSLIGSNKGPVDSQPASQAS